MKSITKIKLFILGGLGFFIPTGVVLAHVGYVEPRSLLSFSNYYQVRQLLTALLSPGFFISAIVVFCLLFCYWWFITQTAVGKELPKRLTKHLKNYGEYTSWIARLSLGIALLGAGQQSVLISPVLDVTSTLAFVERLSGFLLLLGLALPINYLMVIFLFFLGIHMDYYLLGNLDVLGLAVFALLANNPSPGVDDFFGWKWGFVNFKDEWIKAIPRLSTGVAMLFLAIYEKILNVSTSMMIVQDYTLTKVIPVSPELWVIGTGLIEMLLALMLIIGKKVRFASALSIVVLSFTFFYFGESVYSHVTLFGSLSLAFIFGDVNVSKSKK